MHKIMFTLLVIASKASRAVVVIRMGTNLVTGGVRIPYAHTLASTSRLDIHLSCTFRPHDNTINTKDEGRSSTVKLFMVLVSPCLMVAPNNDYVAFSVPIPTDIPSTMKDRVSWKGKRCSEVVLTDKVWD
jgi:hypothetical protein